MSRPQTDSRIIDNSFLETKNVDNINPEFLTGEASPQKIQHEKFQTFYNTIKDKKDIAEIETLFQQILATGTHGFCFSVYEEGQKPGDHITIKQVKRRMEIMKKHTNWVRSFSCIEGNEIIPKVAKQLGLKTMVGAWLGADEAKNEVEMEALIRLAKDGLVDIAVVGNEVLYRKDLGMASLIQNIVKVKEALPDIPVGYVDAYYEFVNHPEITAICDVILCNCYPFWEGTPFENALPHMQHMYHQVKSVAKGKRVIITETGWPSEGQTVGEAVPSAENALHYFLQTQMWVQQNNIESFYFSSFDESWKTGSEGSVGAFWGIWDSLEKLKYV